MEIKSTEQLLACVSINIDNDKRDTFATTLHDTLKKVILEHEGLKVGATFMVPEGDRFKIMNIVINILDETFDPVGTIWGMRTEDYNPYNLGITIQVRKVN